MKSVLISTRPKWVEKICHKIGEDETGKAIYEKRIEVRKTAPQEVPFKCYIYETQGRTETPWIDEDGHFIYKGRGQVIGEFICNNASELDYVYYWNNGYEFATCLTYRQVADYGKGKTLYGWHISDLKIYDRPRELSEFRKSGFMTEEEWLFNLYPNTHCHYEAWAKKFEITRPPQSWCYVEDLGEEK